MKKSIINFSPTIISILLPIIAVDTFDLYIGLVVGGLGMYIMYIINRMINIQRKKEAIPEVLATGYYLNFIEPLSSRINETTRIIKENEPKEIVFASKDIEVNIYKSDLRQLPAVKEEVNKLDKFSIKDNRQDKSFSVRGKIVGEKLKIYDFPNTLFSLQNHFINEFGDKTVMKNEYTERFYEKVDKLISEKISTGQVELMKIELITP